MNIPQNIVPKVSNYSSKAGDFTRTFGIDMSSDYGVIKPTRTLSVANSTDLAELDLAVGFAYYNDRYYALTDDVVLRTQGSANEQAQMNATWDVDDTAGAPTTEIFTQDSDICLFNGSMYVSGADSVFKLTGTTWSEPVTTQLTSGRPHLMTAMNIGGNSRLYVTDDYYRVHSITTGDVISATGTATMNLGLDNDWVISFLEAGLDVIWIGLINVENGRGLVYEWDGFTENVWNRRIELEAGVVAGVVKDNVPYIIDRRGRLMRYAGSSFLEIDRLPLGDRYNLVDADRADNRRFVHANGMVVDDTGKILMLVNNRTTGDSEDIFDDEFVAGVYEYDEQIGLYCKYLINHSDNGQRRLARTGALFFHRSRLPLSTGNGTLLMGCQYFTSYDPDTADSPQSEFGIFINDAQKTSQAIGGFTTPFMLSTSVEEAWQDVTTIFEKITSASDEIMVKYRTIEKNSVSANCNWTSALEFTTTDDVSDFEAGDMITILEGADSGQIMHIKAITSSTSTYTVTVDANPGSATGAFSAKFENFQKLGTITNLDRKQWKTMTFPLTTSTPILQLMFIAKLTGTGIHRLQINNKTNK